MTEKERLRKIELLKQLDAGIINIDQFRSSIDPIQPAITVIYSEGEKWFLLDNNGPWMSKQEMELETKEQKIILWLPYNSRHIPIPPPNN